MNTLVVYESEYGNTERVARAIGAELAKLGVVRVVKAVETANLDLSVDLLLVGGPTQAHGVTRGLRDWIDGVPEAALRGLAVAAFDTRLRWPVLLSGSAAHGIAKALEHRGARLATPPESFFVSDREGPLLAGEVERAATWAATLGATLNPTSTSGHADSVGPTR